MSQDSSTPITSNPITSTPATSNPNAAASTPPAVELVTITIDGKEVSVPKGTNLIEAAKTIGIEIPHYCYHPDLSIAGNCRMCQVKVEGAPKMEIACNCAVKPGMKVSTQHTSKEVADTQAATLELILINHPLDCTICDQAGHCKLQDYHFQYNAKPSRFIENKEHKPKAVELGPNVMLDAERCIMCTRCIRFCDEVTKTSELGMLNRGDRSMIAINPGHELDNPLSGSVVDLCPVGALTHKNWRFNTRIWFTAQTDSICPGCSTGCNVKVATRDGEVVNVKARYNKEVNKEWLCDKGRYGFTRFLPKNRLTAPLLRNKKAPWAEVLNKFSELKNCENVVVIAAADLLFEEYALLEEIVSKNFKHVHKAIPYREIALTELEATLISPDLCPNLKAAELSGFVSNRFSSDYEIALAKIRHGQASGVLLVGENAIAQEDLDDQLLSGLQKSNLTFAMLASADHKLLANLQAVLPARVVLEKSGLLVNRKGRLQYLQAVLNAPEGSEPEWKVLIRLGNLLGQSFLEPVSERELTQKFLASKDSLSKLSIADIKNGGIQL